MLMGHNKTITAAHTIWSGNGQAKVSGSRGIGVSDLDSYSDLI